MIHFDCHVVLFTLFYMDVVCICANMITCCMHQLPLVLEINVVLGSVLSNETAWVFWRSNQHCINTLLFIYVPFNPCVRGPRSQTLQDRINNSNYILSLILAYVAHGHGHLADVVASSPEMPLWGESIGSLLMGPDRYEYLPLVTASSQAGYTIEARWFLC